ncbi:M20/M25/M40 family metallo-hydrolase [Nocardioides terrisoli]|uniref:M20/M25/M40 family metallo-hydrolase n=1 Tax=Nocardioides terrisoli TaxID=3388267 RepID=UPI00287B9909|nr:M20/M25/M40 family metallo-hydrolase [Nocardioides marmorisolisilvae]
MAEHVTPVVDLLQQMIRNRCVNDGSEQSGQESRNADLLESVLVTGGLDIERMRAVSGRDSLIARIEGSDPDAPTLMLMGHTDVVPADPSSWRHDPFGGEIHDGMVWGRGAIDMYNSTASMAIAVKELVQEGWRPRGTLIYLGVADEEAGGVQGARWLTENAWDAVTADYVLTEGGGMSVATPNGRRTLVTVAEKGMYATRITIRGTPSHGSRPYDSDNAVVKAAEVVRRLVAYRPTTHISDSWREYVASMGYEESLAAQLTDPREIWAGLERLPQDHARIAHACTHATVSPNVVHGGEKTNTIAAQAALDVDVRLLPGQTRDDLEELLTAAIGDLRGDVEWEFFNETAPTQTPASGPLWDALTTASMKVRADSVPLPALMTGGTDARFFRARGAQAYGFGMFSNRISLSEWQAMFHASDERVDLESLEMSVAVWKFVARELLS